MRTVQGWLRPATFAARPSRSRSAIEEDLLGLLQAMRRLPPDHPAAPRHAAPLRAQGASASSTG